MSNYKTLLEGVKQSVLLYPEKNALVLQNEIFSYRKLDVIAKKWALLLLSSTGKKRLHSDLATF